MRRRIESVLFAFPVLLLLSGNAHAYLDPGTGSILLQGLIGGIAGALFVLRLYWGKLKTLLSPRARGTPVPAPGPRAEKDR